MPSAIADVPRALFVAPESPYPTVGGGAMRSASLLEYLAPRYRLDCIVFRQPGHPDPRTAFPPGLASDILVLDLPYHARDGWRRVWRNTVRLARRVPPLLDRFAGFGDVVARYVDGRHYDLACIEHFWCAPYIDQIGPRASRTVLDLHNVESCWHESAAAAAGRREEAVAHRVFRDASADLERRLLPRYSLVLATSAADAQRALTIAPCTVAVYPNAIPSRPAPVAAEEDVVAFSASFDYEPNRSGVRHFARSIWPTLRDRCPGLRWRLIGRNTDAVHRDIASDPRIECTGPIQDPVAELAKARVVVVPLLAGSGTRFKIIEAWAAARPVVSTTLGCEGLPAQDGGNILIEDDPHRFAEAVLSLLADRGARETLGAAGRATFDREFTWQAAWRILEEELAPRAVRQSVGTGT
ncbi:MAG: glycosyltransferase [Bryobacterales bacterium]|nr:glycosyltransferase [Bryobacterales bacterium]